MGTFAEEVEVADRATSTPMVERMRKAQQDRLTLAHALVGQAMIETGRGSAGFAAANRRRVPGGGERQTARAFAGPTGRE